MNSKQNCYILTSLIRSSAIVLAMGLSGGMAFAAATAYDTAANYTGSGWNASLTPNNGSGFGAWTVSANGNGGYVGTYLDTGSAITTGGYSWATYANQSASASISLSRAFTTGASGSSSLFNQTFSFDLLSDGVGNGSGGPANSDLSVSMGNAFTFQYLGTGADNFTFSDPTSGLLTTPVGYSQMSAGLVVSLMVSGGLNSPTEAYTFSVSSISGGSPLYTTSGTFDSSAYNTASFNYLDVDNQNNAFFNNLNITAEPVPEPTTVALAGLSGCLTLLALRRRKIIC